MPEDDYIAADITSLTSSYRLALFPAKGESLEINEVNYIVWELCIVAINQAY